MSHPQPSARVSTGMGGCAGKAAGRCSASCAVDADAAALSGAGYPLAGIPNPTVAKANHLFDVFTPQKLQLVAALTYFPVLALGPLAEGLV